MTCPVLDPAVLNGDFGHTISNGSSLSLAVFLKRNASEMTTTALIRPAWTPATIGLMVIGFMVFWPLGLAMLAYIIWGDRLDGFKRDWKGAKGSMFAGCGRHARRSHGFARSGNVAFDDWREKELERLNEERRKLDEARDEFETYARELRRAKDQEEFDRFMSNRNKSTAPATQNGERNGGLLDN